jgi:ferric-dicitrate binding protein FerR (iron transport regulator)/tetratricopeptide (TPR) repeat protein
MNCQQAAFLISARTDREILSEDRPLLEAHLAACPTCRAAAEVLRFQDADLRALFAGSDPAAAALAARVAERIQSEPAAGPRPRFRLRRTAPLGGWLTQRRAGLLAATATLAGLGVLLHLLLDHPAGQPPASQRESQPRPPKDSPVASVFQGLVPLDLPKQPAPDFLDFGQTIETGPRETRRVFLLNRSSVFINQDSRVTLDNDGHLILAAGEVFVEVFRRAPTDQPPFTVVTPQRRVTARGTRFAVRTGPAGTGVVVTQGQVQVTGLRDPVRAGQQLAPGDHRATRAPRTSHLLAWTRDLMAAAQSPLVPVSKYAGGALVILDPDGQETSLTLRRYRLDVHIEDGFARTTIDQTYFNSGDGRTEGTFYFPLPMDASLSRLAMYVNGHLMEGGMAERDYARSVYERILYQQKDPALLEWVDGSTFKMRVFPLEPRQEKRIILSYAQKLPALYGRTQYRFPAGHTRKRVQHWSFHARIKDGAGLSWESTSHPLHPSRSGDDLLLDATGKNVRLDRDLQLTLFDPRGEPGEEVRFSAADHDRNRYLMLRYRPVLSVAPPVDHRRDWVFLFEASGDRGPLLARAQIEVIRALLANAEPNDSFLIISASTQARVLAQGFRPVTAANVRQALSLLEQTHLVGALDLGEALAVAEPFLKSAAHPWLVHVGSGLTGIGEHRPENLFRLLPPQTHYVGVAVGKHWSRAFMNRAAEKTNGFFTRINPNERIAWRAFDLAATLNTPRLLDVKVTDEANRNLFLTHDLSVAQGEELCAVTRLNPQARAGQNAPAMLKSLTITGTLNGQSFRRTIPLKEVAPRADYLPRTWARLEINRLLAEDAWKNRGRIVALSKAMYVMTPFTSLLVLENDAMYKQFKVDRGRKDHWAMYPCPATIPVNGEISPPSTRRKPSVEDVMRTIQVRVPAPLLRWTTSAPAGSEVTLTADQAYAVPDTGADDGAEGYSPFIEADLNQPRRDKQPARPDRGGGTLDIQEQVQDRLEAYNDPERIQRIRRMLAKLAEPVSIEGIAAETPLRDALEFLSDRFDLTIVIDSQAFKRSLNGAAVEDLPVELRQLKRVSLHAVLNLLLSFIPEATYRIGGMHQNLIEITTVARKEAEKKRSPYPILYGGEFLGRGGHFQSGGNSFVVFADDFSEWLGWRSTSWRATRPARFRASQIAQVPPLPLLAQCASVAPDRVSRFWTDLGNQERATNVEGGSTPLDFSFDPKNVDGVAIAIAQGGAADGGRDYLYHRRAFSGDERFFTDLTAFAPGLNTTRPDILAVLESEAESGIARKVGHIEPACRRLINKARTAGWQTVQAFHDGGTYTITFDGQGRYAYQRLLPTGLAEHVSSDGQTLVHLYPDLGLGARRRVSRFHHAEFTRLVPWALPAPEDLARGADLRCEDGQTVIVDPHHPDRFIGPNGQPLPPARLHLVFADNGCLEQRQLVEIATARVLFSEQYLADGTARLRDRAGRDLVVRHFQRRAARAPDLRPDSRRQVILPLPLRTPRHLLGIATVGEDDPVPADEREDEVARPKPDTQLDDSEALSRAAAYFGAHKPRELAELIQKRFLARGDRRLGFYTLLAATGYRVGPGINVEQIARLQAFLGGFAGLSPLGPIPALPVWQLRPRESLDNVLAVHPRDPVARYLAVVSNARLPKPIRLEGRGPWARYLQRLLDFRVLYNRRNDPIPHSDAEAAVRQVRDQQRDALGWAVVSLLHDCLESSSRGRRLLRDTYQALQSVPGLGYEAGYEHARCLLLAGRRTKARDQFLALYARALKDKTLARLDPSARQALLGGSPQADRLAPLVGQTARQLIADNHRPAVVALAWQSWQLADPQTADRLVTAALHDIKDANDRLRTTLVAIEFLWSTGQLSHADDLLRSLLADKHFSGRSSLWRMAASLAILRRQPARILESLERAVDLDFEALPDLLDLDAVRYDFRQLLDRYKQLLDALAVLKQPPPSDLVLRIVRAADRWRLLDPDNPAVCPLAAQLLHRLGARDLAWEYLNTPLALFPPDAESWLDLARALERAQDFDLAARSYAQAFLAEPKSAQILWDQAAALHRAGRTRQAVQVYRRLAEGSWEPRFQWMRIEARRRVSQSTHAD